MGLTQTSSRPDSSLSSLPQWYQEAIAEAYQIATKQVQATNDIVLPELRGNNLVAFNSTAREVILSGPAGTGKSRAWLTKAHYAASKYPGARILLLRKTRESMTDSVLVTFERDVLGDGHPLTFGQNRETRHSYKYPLGSEIVVAGMRHNQKDQTAKVMSTDYDMILVFEATEFQLVEWERLLTRLRSGVLPYQQLGGDCNPEAPSHWIWSRKLSGRIEFLESEHKDNPKWHTGTDWTQAGREYLATLDLLTGYTRDRLRDGKWVQATGVIFDSWSDTENVTEQADYVEGAGSVLWVVDDGYSGQRDEQTGFYTAESHPRVFLLVQCKPDGHLDIFYEHHAIKKLSDTHIAEVKELAYPDPDYAILGPGFAELAGQLFKAGVYSRKLQANVEETIKEAQRMIAPDANGWRRIRAHPRCRLLRSEMMAYARDPQGKVVKAWDHSADCIRYLAWDKRHG